MHNLVYPYKRGKGTDELLRYSIRSAEEHLGGKDGLHSVTVIGDVPSWFTGRGVRNPDHPEGRLHSVLERMRIASELQYDYFETPEGLIKTNSLFFLLMNDDFFIWRPYEPALAHKGALQVDGFHGEYQEAAVTTVDCIAGQKSRWDYSLHCPMPINVMRLRSCLRGVTAPVLVRSLYGNTWLGGGEEKTKDRKAFNAAEVRKYLSDKKTTWMSINDNPETVEAMLSYCREKFTKPSRFEDGS